MRLQNEQSETYSRYAVTFRIHHYQPQWADNTLYTQTNDGDDVAKLSVVASKDVKKGHGMFSCFIHQLHII